MLIKQKCRFKTVKLRLKFLGSAQNRNLGQKQQKL